MREYDIRLETVEKVNRFTALMGRCPCEADLLSARYIVNAKSLLGVFSLDLSGPLVLRLHGQPDAGLAVRDGERGRILEGEGDGPLGLGTLLLLP